MNPVIFTIGGFSLRWYSVCIFVGIVLAYIIASKESKKFDLPKDFLFDLAFWLIIIGIVGARLYYVLFNFKLFKNDLWEIFRVWNGGLAIHGGIIAGFITLIIYCKRKGVKVFQMTDIISIPLLLAQAIGRWGNFFNGEAHGSVTTLSNLENLKFIPDFVIEGMNIGGIYYHPTFYYESLWCLLGVVVLFLVRRYFKYLKVGQLSCLYFMWYGVGRFFIESLRTDSLMIGTFKVAQLFSIVTFLISFILFIILTIKSESLYYEGKKKEK